MFRDIADTELYESLDALVPNTTTTSRIWSFFSRGSKTPASAVDTGGEDAPSESISGNATARASMSFDHPKVEAEENNRISRSRPPCISTNDDNPNGAEGHGTEPKHVLHPTENTSSSTLEQQYTSQEAVVPNFRMGFLLGRGSIEPKEGGYPTAPSPVSNLEFRELRLGI
ncbi:hypothetical protein BWQ96_00529 [Gracilariopsis chorda]|uniref:Uncharacterized protein n=1 Tax=Gracilariopsis chorda TaxID=448386 RepID=A0A2V3J5E8_9FLOR|nr:hypothetical protein BWQ96_00529 [Gracilariopsis chorda]|eukprot:PXF49651.1 hypothetical protein BWQ96_00529 [Gracilariopsis chorda]